MKKGIHPEYVEATVRCACGNTWTTRATKALIRLELCSRCHPFFTGEQRLVDTGGQVEKFMRRMGAKTALMEAATAEAPPEPVVVETPPPRPPRARRSRVAVTRAPVAVPAVASDEAEVQAVVEVAPGASALLSAEAELPVAEASPQPGSAVAGVPSEEVEPPVAEALALQGSADGSSLSGGQVAEAVSPDGNGSDT